MPPQLFALTEGPSILLDKPILLFGRHQECDIQLASRKVSRRHCCIAQVNDYLVVRDLCSTNGVRINGVRVFEGCLRPGDELTIGSYRYQVRWDSFTGDPLRPVPAAVPAAKQVARPTKRAGPTDNPDPLESCEIPIPLEEPGGGARPAPRRLVPPAAPGMPLPAEGQDSRSFILPENLELAPASDVQPASQKPKLSP
jgi:predicted component of type VI protein secretion system